MTDSRSDYDDDRSEDGELQDDPPYRRGRGPQTPPEPPDGDCDSPASRGDGTEDSLDIKPPQAAMYKDKRHRRERNTKDKLYHHKSDSYNSRERYRPNERGTGSRHGSDRSLPARGRRTRDDMSRRGGEMRYGHSENPRSDSRDARQRIREREREREKEMRLRELREREDKERERLERERRRERLVTSDRERGWNERQRLEVDTTIRRCPTRPEDRFRLRIPERSRSPREKSDREVREPVQTETQKERPMKRRLSLRHLGVARDDITMEVMDIEEEEEEVMQIMASDQEDVISTGEEDNASVDGGGSEVNAGSGSNRESAGSGTNSNRSEESIKEEQELEEGEAEDDDDDDDDDGEVVEEDDEEVQANPENSDNSKDSESEHEVEDGEVTDHEEEALDDETSKVETEHQPNGKESNGNNDESFETPEEDQEIPLTAELPPYYPAIQGCRSVEEFCCLNRIEEGTYGVVYRARDKRTNHIVALKRLKMEREKEGFPITSLREVNTLLKSQHPNIVTVQEIVVGSNMDKIYIVMDYVEHDMKSLMESMKQPFTPGEVKTLMIQLLQAVAHLHDNWIIHRDLKTSNLLLSHKGILKVGDFGLAREYGSPLKQYSPVVVTLWYRAPELLLGTKKYSTPIDMWSVGCIFGEFLTKKPLFPGKSEFDQLNCIYKDLGTPNETSWPGYDELPLVKKLTFFNIPFNTLRKRFSFKRRNSTVTSFLTDSGFDLINKFLTYDPARRVSAEDALKHEFFNESPLPVEPSMFPTWPAKSELGHPRTTHSPKPPSGGKLYKQLGEDDDDLSKYGFLLNAGISYTGPSVQGAGFNLKF